MDREKVTIETLMEIPDVVMRKLELKGEWTAPSDIYNTGYCAIKGHFTILRGNYGAMAIPIKDIRKLSKELAEYADILEYRKNAKIKGA